MIPDLARLLRLERRPARRQRRQSAAGGGLDINERSRREPAALLEQRGGGTEQRRAERRIEKHHIERARRALEVAQRVGALDLATLRAPLGESRVELARRGRVVLDEGNLRGPTRQGLEPESAAAGEQIEAARARDARASQLNSVSRTRSGVGRMSASRGKRSFLPRQAPPMIRSTRACAPRAARGRLRGTVARPPGWPLVLRFNATDFAPRDRTMRPFSP